MKLFGFLNGITFWEYINIMVFIQYNNFLLEMNGKDVKKLLIRKCILKCFSLSDLEFCPKII